MADTQTPISPGTGELPPPQRSPEELRKRVAFGGYVKSELYDVFGVHDLSAVTPADIEQVKPQNIGKFLFDLPYNPNDDTEGGQFQHDNVIKGVALNPYELTVIMRSPDASKIGRVAYAATAKKEDMSDELQARARRSYWHAIESKRDAMVEHKEKLHTRWDRMGLLLREARSPKYAHFSRENFNLLVGEFWQEVQTILEVLREVHGWNDDEQQQARAAMVAYMTTGPQTQRVKHTKEVIKFVRRYLVKRQGVFAHRIARANEELAKRPAEDIDVVE